MADQEFLSSYAVDIDEEGVERLQSILSENRDLALQLSSAFQQAYTGLTSLVQAAQNSVSSLQLFRDAQGQTVKSANDAEVAIKSLTDAYSDLLASIPSGALELNVPSIDGTGGGKSETGDKSQGSALLTDISSSLNRLVILTAGRENVTDGNGKSGAAPIGTSGSADIGLSFAGASEALQCFMDDLASSGIEIDAGVDLTRAQESVNEFRNGIQAGETALPLRLDRTRAESSLSDLQRLLSQPVQFRADMSAVRSAASSALTAIINAYSGAKLTLNAEVNTPKGVNKPQTSDVGAFSGPLVSTLMTATGGRFTRPTNIQVSEDNDTEYVIPVKKEPIAVPLVRQMFGELSDSAKESVLNADLQSILAARGSVRPDTPPDITKKDLSSESKNAPESLQNPNNEHVVVPDFSPQIQVNIPDVNVPDISVPEVKVPDIFVPEINIPDIEVPELSVPEIKNPDIVLPDIQVPDIDASGIRIPEVNIRENPEIVLPDIPDISVPDIVVPDIAAPVMPDILIPEAELPEFDIPEIRVPDVDVPDIIVPEMQALDIDIPDVVLPDMQVPEVMLPDIQAPDIPAPSVELPDIQVPDMPAPDIALPDIQVPDIQLPENPAPELTVIEHHDSVDSGHVIPDISIPQIEMPDISIPEIKIPDMSDIVNRLAAFSEDAMKAISSLPLLLNSAPAAVTNQHMIHNDTKNIEAPVSINVTASGTNAELMAQSIYDSAQRHLIRTLRGVK